VTAFSQPDYREIQIVDAATGKMKKRFTGHTGGIRSGAFLADGRHIISGSTDKTLRMWDVQTGEEVARLETENHFTNHVAVSRDGRTVASGGGHFQISPGYKMRAHDEKMRTHDIQEAIYEYARDGDYDIRLWRLPESVWPEPSAPEKETAGEADPRDSSPDASPSEDSP
jgi:tricorn protease-like protein